MLSKTVARKLDELKAEALDKANRLTASRFRQDRQVVELYKKALADGKAHGDAAKEAVARSGATLGSVQAHLRGWYLCLSLDEPEEGPWRWALSVTKSATIGAGPADLLELAMIVARLGGTFDEPWLVPERDGTKAIFWRWDHAEKPA